MLCRNCGMWLFLKVAGPSCVCVFAVLGPLILENSEVTVVVVAMVFVLAPSHAAS